MSSVAHPCAVAGGSEEYVDVYHPALQVLPFGMLHLVGNKKKQ